MPDAAEQLGPRHSRGSALGGRVTALRRRWRRHDLRDLFCLLPSWPIQRVLDLAPAYWQRTFAEPEVQQRLASNVYRQATLKP